MQAEEEDASKVLEKYPFLHKVQDKLPASEYFPIVQIEQVGEAREVTAYLPAAQIVHNEEPSNE